MGEAPRPPRGKPPRGARRAPQLRYHGSGAGARQAPRGRHTPGGTPPPTPQNPLRSPPTRPTRGLSAEPADGRGGGEPGAPPRPPVGGTGESRPKDARAATHPCLQRRQASKHSTYTRHCGNPHRGAGAGSGMTKIHGGAIWVQPS